MLQKLCNAEVATPSCNVGEWCMEVLHCLLCYRQRLLMMGHHRGSDYGSPGLPSPAESTQQQRTPRRPVIKKPLNAFMLFMKEMRQKVIDECTLKESAAINQILGRKVTNTLTHSHTHSLTDDWMIGQLSHQLDQF